MAKAASRLVAYFLKLFGAVILTNVAIYFAIAEPLASVGRRHVPALNDLIGEELGDESVTLWIGVTVHGTAPEEAQIAFISFLEQLLKDRIAVDDVVPHGV